MDDAKSILDEIGGSTADHTESVVRLALEIAGHYPELDRDLIEVAAWWHDTGRIRDPNHEKISAEMAVESLARTRWTG